MAVELAERARSGGLEVVTARPSHYFGPRGTSQSPLGERVIGRAIAGRTAQVIGDPDVPHTYTFLPDIGRTLHALGTQPGLAGEVFHVPSPPAMTTREVVAEVARQLGHDVSVKPTPRALLRLVGIFNPTVRELDEMRYEFEEPFIMDASRAEERLGLAPTPMPDALAATIEWFRRQ